MYCFQCGREYVAEVSECVECGVELVDEKPTPPEEVGGENEPQVAYELFEWSFEARRMVDQLLTGEGIAHGWQGAVLIVREADEDRADALIEQAETAEGPRLDPDIDKVAYGMEEWSAEAQSALVDALGLAGVAHEFDADGDLVVAEEDEERVDEIVEQVARRIAIEDELGEAGTELEGLALSDLIGEVHGLARKLDRNPGDAKSTLAMVKQAGTLADVRTPFGFDSERWAAIRQSSSAMVGILSTEDRDEDDVRGAASALHEQLAGVI